MVHLGQLAPDLHFTHNRPHLRQRLINGAEKRSGRTDLRVTVSRSNAAKLKGLPVRAFPCHAVAIVVAAVSHVGVPVINGSYNGGELGVIELMVNADGTFQGKRQAGGGCESSGDGLALKGGVEGTVFVGQIRPCVPAPLRRMERCKDLQWVPFLALVSAVPNSPALSGWIHTPAECSETKQGDRRLTLSLIPAEKSKSLIKTPEAASRNVKGDDEQKRLLAMAQGKLDEGKLSEAYGLFREASLAATSNYATQFGMALSLLRMGRVEPSLQALTLAARAPGFSRMKAADQAPLSFAFACAYAQLGRKAEALASLKQAIKLGGARAYAQPVENEVMLASLRDTVEFRRLAAEVQLNSKRGP